MRSSRWRGALVGLALAAQACASGGGAPSPTPVTASEARRLRILLTNDDGWDAPGIRAVREALVAAGHDVVLVAPAANQSGTGTRMDVRFGERFVAEAHGPDAWSVEGAPADAVFFGLDVALAGRPPDLVVSGANFGHNAGRVANHSGTVGAAVTALALGVPAIAVSTELDRTAGPDATLAAFAPTARFTTALVARLAETAGEGPLLPPGIALNVNYPVVGMGAPATGVAWTRIGERLIVRPGYRPAPDGGFTLVPVLPETPDPGGDTDTAALAADRVSMTAIDGDWSAGGPSAGALARRLGALAP